jgi:hypothetical protein
MSSSGDNGDDPGRPLFALGFIERHRDVPPDLDFALEQTTPQALLRDLHRPHSSFGVTLHDFERLPFIKTDGGGDDAAERRKVLLASYRVPIDTLIPTRNFIDDDRATLRALLAMPWSEAPKLGIMTDEEEQEISRYFGG